MYHRAILHLDIDAFFASVEQLENSSLKGKPVVVGGMCGRGLVSSCNYEARRYGIHTAMPMKLARRLCPHAVYIRGDKEKYQNYSRLITEIISEQAPLFEKASLDEFYLDLTGMDKYIGCYHWAKELRAKILHQAGLPLSFGLSANKLIAKIGTGEGKPNGCMQVAKGKEKRFIAPLPVQKLPAVGKVTAHRLQRMGVQNIKTLSEIPPKLLQREFGKTGISLWKKANAIDNSPVIPYREKKAFSAEHNFEQDTIDVQLLQRTLYRILEKLCFDLRQAQKLTASIRLKIKYTDGNTYTKQKRISYTASDKVIAPHLKELFNTLHRRRQLVRLVGIRFDKLVHGNLQMNLFDDTAKEAQLLQKMDAIRKRFGKESLLRGGAL